MVKLRRDSTIDKLCQEANNEHSKKFFKNPRLRIDDVYEIVNSQFEIMSEAFLNQDSIKIDYIGKFIIKERRREFLIEERGIMPKQPPELERVKVIFKTKPKI